MYNELLSLILITYGRLFIELHRLAKIAEVKSKLHGAGGFRENLKSTGQPKFALDDDEGVSIMVILCDVIITFRTMLLWSLAEQW